MQKSDKPALRIRTIRESKGYTQEYMAEMMGICQSTYAHMESGKSKMSIDRFLQIAEILGTDFARLIESPTTSSRATDRHVNDQESINEIKQMMLQLREEMDVIKSKIIEHK